LVIIKKNISNSTATDVTVSSNREKFNKLKILAESVSLPIYSLV